MKKLSSIFSLGLALLMLNEKIICQDFQFFNNYPADYDPQNYNENSMLIPKVENYHPPKGYQPVKGYEPPNYKPNINNHIIFQEKPKLINTISETNYYNTNDGQDTNFYQSKNANEYTHPLFNLNRMPQNRYPPINRPANTAPFNWTNYQNSMVFFQATTAVVSQKPNLPTLHQYNTGTNYDSENWRRTPVTNKFTSSTRYVPTTTEFNPTISEENTQTSTKSSSLGSKPIPTSLLTSSETKTNAASSTTTTTSTSTKTTTTSTSTTTTRTTTSVTTKSSKTTTTTTSTTSSTSSLVSTTVLPSTTSRRRKTKTTKKSTKTTSVTTTTSPTTTTTTVPSTTTTEEDSDTTRKKTTSKQRTKTTKKPKPTRIKSTTSVRTKTTSTITPPIRKTNFTYTTTSRYGNSKNMIIDENCMKCLCFIESWCADVGCVMDQGSLSCGWYQLKYEYWLDCGQPGGSWKDCSNDKVCAEQCVRQYMTRYGGLCSTGNSCADLARIHNGGPYGCSARHTEYYGNMISRCLKRQSPYENIDELYKNTFPDAA